jgi:trans-aconitate methyltransferase
VFGSLKSLDSEIDSFLFDFYELSFKSLLALTFPRNEAYRYLTLADYITGNLNPNQRVSVSERLKSYTENIAPFLKYRPLLEFLKKTPNPSKEILDFGCASGISSRWLFKMLKAKRLYGVDTDSSVLPRNIAKLAKKFLWVNSLTEINNPSEQIDLITIVHTLHHLTTNTRAIILNDIHEILNEHGLIYVLEDSLDDILNKVMRTNHFDQSYHSFDNRKRKQVLLRNDYWSNSWTYGRELDSNVELYHSSPEWRETLVSIGFEVLEYGFSGFDPMRLHGVPSTWIIARKREQ